MLHFVFSYDWLENYISISCNILYLQRLAHMQHIICLLISSFTVVTGSSAWNCFNSYVFWDVLLQISPEYFVDKCHFLWRFLNDSPSHHRYSWVCCQCLLFYAMLWPLRILVSECLVPVFTGRRHLELGTFCRNLHPFWRCMQNTSGTLITRWSCWNSGQTARLSLRPLFRTSR